MCSSRKHFNRGLVLVLPGFGASFEIALKPSYLQKVGENCAKVRTALLHSIRRDELSF